MANGFKEGTDGGVVAFKAAFQFSQLPGQCFIACQHPAQAYEGAHDCDVDLLYRFFKVSQFKRSAIPNGPKISSGGSLSPWGDWCAPSESEPELWLKQLRENVQG